MGDLSPSLGLLDAGVDRKKGLILAGKERRKDNPRRTNCGLPKRHRREMESEKKLERLCLKACSGKGQDGKKKTTQGSRKIFSGGTKARAKRGNSIGRVGEADSKKRTGEQVRLQPPYSRILVGGEMHASSGKVIQWYPQ